MWQLRAQAVDWLTLHLVFTVLMTLVFKAPLALISNVLINVAMVVIGRNEWTLLGANVLVTGIVPAAIIGTVWRLVDRRLPDNLMVFLFAENADFAPIEIDLRSQSLDIEGVGVGVIRGGNGQALG